MQRTITSTLLTTQPSTETVNILIHENFSARNWFGYFKYLTFDKDYYHLFLDHAYKLLPVADLTSSLYDPKLWLHLSRITGNFLVSMTLEPLITTVEFLYEIVHR